MASEENLMDGSYFLSYPTTNLNPPLIQRSDVTTDLSTLEDAILYSTSRSRKRSTRESKSPQENEDLLTWHSIARWIFDVGRFALIPNQYRYSLLIIN